MTEDESGAAGRGSPSIAESLALGAEAAHGRLDPRAAAFLEKQSVLTDLQIEDLKREDRLRHWSLRVRHISDVLKLSFELALALIFTAIVFIIGAAIRSAADDNGVVIESFSVPPDLAAKGLSGDVIATKVLDRLSAMQFQTNSRRAASSYANNWGENIKVQIPDTGVSVGELNRFLHEWLGSQTHITGEIYRSANGIAITARAGNVASPSFTGSEDNLDKLIQQAAEAVYRTTQPYRYAIWLADHNRAAEAGAVLQNVARTGSIHERAWAYLGLGVQMQAQGDYAGSAAMMRRAIALDPDLLLAYDNLAGDEGSLQHDEQSIAIVREALAGRRTRWRTRSESRRCACGQPAGQAQSGVQSRRLRRRARILPAGSFRSRSQQLGKRAPRAIWTPAAPSTITPACAAVGQNSLLRQTQASN